MPPKRRFLVLDAMRGVAAIFVAQRHTQELCGHHLCGASYLAVDFFFALSGLVLAEAYGAELDAGLGSGRFLAMRVARLYPLYLLGGILGLVPIIREATRLPLMRGYAMGVAVCTLALLPHAPFGPASGHPAPLYPADVVAWSIAAELLVNFFYAALWTRLRGGSCSFGLGSPRWSWRFSPGPAGPWISDSDGTLGISPRA